MPRAIIGRWGKNLAIRLPGEVAREAGFSVGQRVEIAAKGDELVIRKLRAETTVEAMFAGLSPEVWRALYREAFDWAPIGAASASRNERGRILARRRLPSSGLISIRHSGDKNAAPIDARLSEGVNRLGKANALRLGRHGRLWSQEIAHITRPNIGRMATSFPSRS
jgi:antitoxin MazE